MPKFDEGIIRYVCHCGSDSHLLKISLDPEYPFLEISSYDGVRLNDWLDVRGVLKRIRLAARMLWRGHTDFMDIGLTVSDAEDIGTCLLAFAKQARERT